MTAQQLVQELATILETLERVPQTQKQELLNHLVQKLATALIAQGFTNSTLLTAVAAYMQTDEQCKFWVGYVDGVIWELEKTEEKAK